MLENHSARPEEIEVHFCKCEFCPKVFKSRQALGGHMKIHPSSSSDSIKPKINLINLNHHPLEEEINQVNFRQLRLKIIHQIKRLNVWLENFDKKKWGLLTFRDFRNLISFRLLQHLMNLNVVYCSRRWNVLDQLDLLFNYHILVLVS